MNQSNTFEIRLNNFQGPLDLLLELIKDKKMDIFAVDLAELATSYINFIATMRHANLDLASEYLVMAATLIQIKARMLLETPSDNKKIDREKEDLLRRLTEYHQYKRIAQQLRERETLRMKIGIKGPEDYTQFQQEIDETRLDGHSDPVALIMALRKMFERTRFTIMRMRSATIETFNLSPADRRMEIIRLYQTNPHTTFAQIFAVPTLNHFAVTVLTVLDMARREELIIAQQQQFGEITIAKGVINE